jgi:hypothetical protein
MSRRQWGDDSTVNLKLSAGSSITVVFKGNLFDLTAAERQLITDLSAVVQQYEAGAAVSAKEEASS